MTIWLKVRKVLGEHSVSEVYVNSEKNIILCGHRNIQWKRWHDKKASRSNKCNQNVQLINFILWISKLKEMASSFWVVLYGLFFIDLLIRFLFMFYFFTILLLQWQNDIVLYFCSTRFHVQTPKLSVHQKRISLSDSLQIRGAFILLPLFLKVGFHFKLRL